MLGFVESVLHDGELTPAGRAQLRAAQRNGLQLRELVDDLLLLARAGAGELPLERADVDLAALVKRTVAGAQARASAAGVGLWEELRPVSARGDETLLRRLTRNLVENAIRSTTPGGDVLVRTLGAGRSAVLEVLDTGEGVDEAALERVFQPFDDLQGAAMGPAVARAIAEAHGGGVDVASRSGVGTSFRVRLPATPAG